MGAQGKIFGDLIARYGRWIPGSDVFLALLVVLLLSILVFPLPTPVLDFGLAVSVISSVLVLMVALFIETPLSFTSFPTLLLLTTLLRLALEVATTRLILSHGYEGNLAAGHVVAAFGGFLMGGDLFIGVILFVILLVVNFMVITKGSGRIAEVAARFSLDAMPGKQMAIDAELSSGAITDAVAKGRRRDLESESGFFGSMDGAAKFVRGDAIASLIITAINIVGGLAIGVGRHGMGVADAASAFTSLTVGDGLVAQIPALLVSTAAGIVVTKGGVEGSTDKALVSQLGGNVKPLALAAGTALVLGLMPGLPFVPFAALAGAIGGFGYHRMRKNSLSEGVDLADETAPAVQVSDAPISDSLKIDMLRLELGINILGIANGEGARLTEQIKGIRKNIAMEFGYILPPVRIQDNLALPENCYCVKIKEIEVARGELRLGSLLALNPNGGVFDLAGEATKDPAFGLPALWIEQRLREAALTKGYTVVDPADIIATHLAELAKDNAAELLSYAETQKLLDELPREQQKLVMDLVPSMVSVGVIQRVLQTFLAERVSVRDLVGILEGIQEACSLGIKSVHGLVGHVRMRLSRQISMSYSNKDALIPVISISPDWESRLSEHMVGPNEDRRLALPPTLLNEFVVALRRAIENSVASGEVAIVLVNGGVRQAIREIVERIRPSLPVMSHNEVYARVKIKTVAVVS